MLLGLDVDQEALKIAEQHLCEFGERVNIHHASYTTLDEELQQLNWVQVNGIILDLGVSSIQLDTSKRGFSFQKDGPLDMRFNTEQTTTAADLINTLPESEISDLIWRYSDEVKHRKIARAINQARPIETTLQLAEIVRKAVSPKGHYKVHPATRTFQAIRIAVNQEMASLEKFLPLAIEALAPGGILAVISFHSIEDRIVKHFFRKESSDCICSPEQPVCTCHHVAQIVNITRRPVTASAQEILNNPRARSARLRIAQKI